MEEIWKDIEGYEGRYQVSNLGNVKSLNYRNSGYAKNLTPKCNNSNRLWVELTNGKSKRQLLVHRLVAAAFIPNDNNYPEVNHKDENPHNNNASNLEWCTRQYNVAYYYHRHPHGADRNSTDKYRCGKDKPVGQFNKDGHLVNYWDNSRAIFLETGMSDWSISECCRGNRKTAYGYIWQYVS